MNNRIRLPLRLMMLALVVSIPAVCRPALAAEGKHASLTRQDELWQRGVDLIEQGRFAKANDVLEDVSAGGRVTEKVKGWLAEFEKQQAKRAELNREDFEKYVKYAKDRVTREEYARALDWVLLAADVTQDRDDFVRMPWVKDLVEAALARGRAFSDEADWRSAYDLYWRLGELFEDEPRYRKLERETLTHLRLDLVFKKDSKWEEQLDGVRWRDAKRALEKIEIYYVEPVDWRESCESALEQLLILAESRSAREHFEGLANARYRGDFTARVSRWLDRVKVANDWGLKETSEAFRRVIKDINKQTVQLPEELVVSEMMRGALEPLDDFTDMIWPAEVEEFEKHTRGDFIGVGISIIKNRRGEIEVSSPLEDTPAYRAGIQAGDIITEVDGKPLKGFSLTKTVKTITGPEGSPVKLTVRRNGTESKYTLNRAKVKIHSVKGVSRSEDDPQAWDHWLDKEQGVGYVRITNFQANTVEDLFNTIQDLRSQGLQGLVLDLRGNPGGLLSSAYQVSSLFLEKDEGVVSTKGRIPSEDLDSRTIMDGPFTDIPLTVLVDESSASASEIVSGAIRDNHRGKVIGARTFGKFSVQNLVPLGYSKARLKITTAHYYLPSGVSLHRKPGSDTWGVEPDISLRLIGKERMNVWKMRREADRIGPAPNTEDEEKTADAEKSDDEKADGEKVAEKTDKEFDRFRVRGYYLSDFEVVKPDEGEDDRSIKLLLEDEPATVKALDAKGQELLITDMELDPGETQIKVEATGADGNRAAVDKLLVDGRALAKVTLPPIEQPDENERPMIDPQLDAALLFMRVKLLDQRFDTLAKAEETDLDGRKATP